VPVSPLDAIFLVPLYKLTASYEDTPTATGICKVKNPNEDPKNTKSITCSLIFLAQLCPKVTATNLPYTPGKKTKFRMIIVMVPVIDSAPNMPSNKLLYNSVAIKAKGFITTQAH
jgi:hypothetical protein